MGLHTNPLTWPITAFARDGPVAKILNADLLALHLCLSGVDEGNEEVHAVELLMLENVVLGMVILHPQIST